MRGSLPFIKVLILDKQSRLFAIGVIAGLAFSISVILATIGIMDGYEHTLTKTLRRNFGDFTVTSLKGFFNEDDYESEVEDLEKSFMIQTQGFLKMGKYSHGVIVKGVEAGSFSKVTGYILPTEREGVFLGEHLYRKFKESGGRNIVLALASGGESFSSLPQLRNFKVAGGVRHGLHELDSRVVYMDLAKLQKMIGARSRVNSLVIRSHELGSPFFGDELDRELKKRRRELSAYFRVAPYTKGFRGLLDAVRAEKFMIVLILQIIVLVSIFNLSSFIIFLNEKKSRELFLFEALGMGPRELVFSWVYLGVFLWALACFFAVLLVQFYDYLLQNLAFLQLPGDIYRMGNLSIILDSTDYYLVFFLALFWLLIVLAWNLRLVGKSQVASRLRRVFA